MGPKKSLFSAAEVQRGAPEVGKKAGIIAGTGTDGARAYMAARLTDSHVRKARAAARPRKLTDGHGLYLLVQPNGSKLWRYRYRIGGAENLFALGQYPNMTLAQARIARDSARSLVKQGIHPAKQRRAATLVTQSEAAATFEAVAIDWIGQQRPHWTASYARQVESVLRSDVFTAIGGIPIRTVSAAQILAILTSISERGATSIAVLVRQWVSAIFRHAIATLRADTDPTFALRGAIRKPKTKHKRPLRSDELYELMERVRGGRSAPHIQIALQLLLNTFVRPGELRQAHWSEFDFEAALWRIPAERMKMREAHVVPLSKQSIGLLEKLREVSPPTTAGLLFGNRRDPRRAMSPTTLNRALERAGYRGSFSAHGFRATASTLLNELGFRPDVIERQLAHKERNSVRASYNRASYLPERHAMMQAWSDFAEGAHSTNVVAINRPRAG